MRGRNLFEPTKGAKPLIPNTILIFLLYVFHMLYGILPLMPEKAAVRRRFFG
jgi:hypothetical protein